MTGPFTNRDVQVLTHALPNCVVAVAPLPGDAGLWLRLHDGKTVTIPPDDLPADGDRAGTERAIYQACLERQRVP